MNYVVCDIETAADETCLPLMEPPAPPANYKDPEKIAAWQAEAAQKQIGTMALKASQCRIVALGLDDAVMIAPSVDAERSVLSAFWNFLSAGHGVVGFNFLAFDLPVIIVRSKMLRVPIPAFINYRKYGMDRIRDLMLELDPAGQGWQSLTWWCKRLALDVPDDPSTGADITALVTNGDWDGVMKHCEIDLIKTRALLSCLDND